MALTVSFGDRTYTLLKLVLYTKLMRILRNYTRKKGNSRLLNTIRISLRSHLVHCYLNSMRLFLVSSDQYLSPKQDSNLDRPFQLSIERKRPHSATTAGLLCGTKHVAKLCNKNNLAKTPLGVNGRLRSGGSCGVACIIGCHHKANSDSKRCSGDLQNIQVGSKYQKPKF